MESPGIDPGASRMLSERSTIWASLPLFCRRTTTFFHRRQWVVNVTDYPGILMWQTDRQLYVSEWKTVGVMIWIQLEVRLEVVPVTHWRRAVRATDRRPCVPWSWEPPRQPSSQVQAVLTRNIQVSSYLTWKFLLDWRFLLHGRRSNCKVLLRPDSWPPTARARARPGTVTSCSHGQFETLF